MRKKIKPEDHKGTIKNGNKGTKGTNELYDKAQGNRGKQLQMPKKSTKK